MRELVGSIASIMYMLAIMAFAAHFAWAVLHWSALPASLLWLPAVLLCKIAMVLTNTPDPMGDWKC